MILPWMKVPLFVSKGQGVALASVRGMNARLLAAMQSEGYGELFPVQAAAWHVLAGGMSRRHDLCIAAPTGSGKTLAYALPVLQRCVASPIRDGTRALVVLPTRDLARQVYAVFCSLCTRLPGIKVGLMNGCGTVHEEADMLSGAGASASNATWSSMLPAAHAVYGADAGGLMTVQRARDALTAEVSSSGGGRGRWGELPGDEHSACGGRRRGLKRARGDAWAPPGPDSSVTVLIATPGRLVYHMEHTPALRLSALEFLVVDELDRLLRQDYQGWLPKVLAAAQGPTPADEGQHVSSRRVIKLVVSATLTRDPSKLARLDLHAPRFVALDGQGQSHKLPETLAEFKVVTGAAQKPAAVVALLRALLPEKTLVFASSLEATHRLALLLRACPCLRGAVAEHSSLIPDKERAASLARFRAGHLSVLVASDAFTRGMDVPGVMNVVNYDMPAHANTYVHRAGRTARAGASGKVFTILRKEHVGPFKAMLRKADNNFVQDYVIADDVWESVQDEVKAALEELGRAIAQELH